MSIAKVRSAHQNWRPAAAHAALWTPATVIHFAALRADTNPRNPAQAYREEAQMPEIE
jgi:hypothetical protein